MYRPNHISRLARRGVRVKPKPSILRGLVAHWPLREEAGNRTDSHGGLTLTDGNTVTGGIAYQGAMNSKMAAQFTSSSTEYLETTSVSSVPKGDIDFSVAAWIFLDTVPAATDPTIVCHKGGGNATWTLRVRVSDGKAEFKVYDSASAAVGTVASAAAIPLKTWIYLVGWHDAANNLVGLSVQGAAATSSATTGAPGSNATALTIGADHLSSVTYPFNGRICDVSLWTGVLSDARIADMYDGGHGRDLVHVAKEGLVEWWPLCEVSSSRYGDIAGLTLTDNNTVTWGFGPFLRGALVGSQFTAANTEYLSRASESLLQAGDIDFTFTAWVYVDSFSNDLRVVSKRANATNSHEYDLYITTAGVLSFELRTSGGTLFAAGTAAGAVVAGQWYFIVAWHDAAADTVNVQLNNGTAASTATAGQIPATNTSTFMIGQLQQVTRPFNGRICQVAFFKRVLTTAEKTGLYNGGRGVPFGDFPKTSLVGFWPLAEASGSRYDLVNGLTLTDNNTVTGNPGPTPATRKASLFTAANDEYLERASDSSVQMGNIDFTIACWAKFNVMGGTTYYAIVTKDNTSASTREYSLYTNPDPGVSFGVWNGAGSSVGGANLKGAAFGAGCWYFIVARFDVTNGKITTWVNGAKTRSAISGSAGTNSVSFRIGNDKRTSNFIRLDGLIHSVSLWKRALTDAEIFRLYAGGFGKPFPFL